MVVARCHGGIAPLWPRSTRRPSQKFPHQLRESPTQAQGEAPGCVNHSYTEPAAHEMLGTRSTARVAANTNKAASTITAKLFIDRVISTSFPPLLRRGVPAWWQAAGRVADPGLEGRQVAVLHHHAAVSWLRNGCIILTEPGEPITQMSYLLQLSS